MKPNLRPITDADKTRLHYVRDCVDQARLLLHQAGVSLMEGVNESEGEVINAYLTEWARLTGWIDAAPVTAYQYHVTQTWTGGDLNGAGSQTVAGWPVCFGDAKLTVYPVGTGTVDDHLHDMIAKKTAAVVAAHASAPEVHAELLAIREALTGNHPWCAESPARLHWAVIADMVPDSDSKAALVATLTNTENEPFTATMRLDRLIAWMEGYIAAKTAEKKS